MALKTVELQIVKLRQKGLTYRVIQSRLGCDHTQINRALRDVGLAGPQRLMEVEDKEEISRLLLQGHSVNRIASLTGWSASTIRLLRARNGGCVPKLKSRCELRLSFAEREEISRGLVAGMSLRLIAQDLGRAVSTISREVKANGGRNKYRAWAAENRAQELAQRPKVAKLVQCPGLRTKVQQYLKDRFSPQQISTRLMNEHPGDDTMQISHEAIYQSLFIQGRGALRRELTACLRTGRAVRRPQKREQRGRIPSMVKISERPAEIEDRAVPGHWEGDLIIGKDGKSAIGTLVERSTRYVMLMKLKNQKAETVREALIAAVKRLPEELFQSLTWDQGREMTQHAQFTLETGVDVYFCDPHSPWQRGTNENTNGLLRQYFPKGTSLSGHSQQHLDAVARQLNRRPRMTLSWKTPAERLDELLR